MQIGPLGDGDYIKTWVLFFISVTIGGLLAGALGGGFVGFVLGLFGAVHALPMSTFKLFCGIAGFIAALPVHFFLFRYFVGRLIASKEIKPDRVEPLSAIPPSL